MLDKMSFQGIFINYSLNQQTRIYNSATNKIQWHIFVKFLKHI